MLIRRAEIPDPVTRISASADVRLAKGGIAEIGNLVPEPGETVIEAKGGALLPGLHDHHIHLAALAVRSASVPCGPPAVLDPGDLAAALARPGTGWLRGIGYHESVMGLPDAAALDALQAERPVRIQHRGGRLWLLNSRALGLLLEHAPPPPGLERVAGTFTGRLFDEDRWLQSALGATPPDFGAVSAELASCGVTGLTDMSPGNDAAMAAHFAAQRAQGRLMQNCMLAGTLELGLDAPKGWTLGPAKLHLHEAALPDFDQTLAFMRTAHAAGRTVAVHCTTEVELVFTLALFDEAGSLPGDRVEHASVVLPDHVERLAALGLAICVQPHFIAERGDSYLRDVETRALGGLYRLSGLASAGIALAGGSDAPFGSCDPWLAMRAAVSRQTAAGAVISADEALGPEQALSLYLRHPADLTRNRQIAPGEPADLCLLDRPWRQARLQLDSACVRATFIAGQRVFDSIDQAP